MAREKLMLVDEDDRSFGEQLADLGVTTVKPLIQPIWYTPRHNDKRRLYDKISLARTGIYVGEDVAKHLPGRYKIGMSSYKGKPVLLFQPHEKGFPVLYPDGKARIGSKQLAAWLLSQGMPAGKYSLQRIKGAYMGVLAE